MDDNTSLAILGPAIHELREEAPDEDDLPAALAPRSRSCVRSRPGSSTSTTT
jgi:hypothetical protein